MAKIVILGAGVMGSALAVTAASHAQNQVTLAGSPLDNDIIDCIHQQHFHPALKVDIAANIIGIKESDLTAQHLRDADIIVIGVSSPGVPWAVGKIRGGESTARCIAMVTKGLQASDQPGAPPLTYADALEKQLPREKLLGIGGPCIARELALGMPTFVTFSADDIALARDIRTHFQTDYYRVAVHPDFVAMEACAALKNFYCIGVSAMLGAWEIEGQHAKNPVAALFNQAVLEMDILARWIQQATDNNEAQLRRENWRNVAFDLPGMGDLHVTVGGGRNSRLGTLLGRGQTLKQIVEGPMSGVTVEGLDTGKQLLPGYKAAVENGSLQQNELPLTHAILNSIAHDSPFTFEFSRYSSG